MGNKNSVWVLLKRATTPTRLHLHPLSLTHPRTIYFQLPLPTNKKCPPTPIYPKYISTNPHSPRIYLHPPTPTPVTHKNVHSNKIYLHLPPNHPEHTTIHPCKLIRKCPPSPIQPKYTSKHPHLTLKILTHPQPPKIISTHPHLRHNIKSPYNYL